jgi:hypothetical protein
LRDGVIAEGGGFAELVRRGGVFAEYYRTQFAADEPTPEPTAAALPDAAQYSLVR